MIVKLHQLVSVVGVPQLIAIGILAALWLLEQILAQTKRVRANSIVQAMFNVLWQWSAGRFPLVTRLGNLADQIAVEVKTVETTTTATIDATPAESPSARTKQ